MFEQEYKVLNARKSKRLKANYLLKFWDAKTGQGPELSNIKDISSGGVRFWTEQFMPQGTVIRLSVLVPPLGKSVDALARVQRIRLAQKAAVFYVSAVFLELAEEDSRALQKMTEDVSLQPAISSLIDHPEIVKRSARRQLA